MIFIGIGANLPSRFGDRFKNLREGIKRIYQYVPWIKNYSFIINSNNSFPHSSGIASSASSMASLSLCLMDIERILFPEMELDYFNNLEARLVAPDGLDGRFFLVYKFCLISGQHFHEI